MLKKVENVRPHVIIIVINVVQDMCMELACKTDIIFLLFFCRLSKKTKATFCSSPSEMAKVLAT